MIEEIARVKALRGHQAVVEVMRQSGCQSCQLNGSCGTGSLGRLLGFKSRPLLIDNEHDLAVGDSVVIALQENAYVLASTLVYLLPLALMLAFAILAELVLQAPDAVVAVVAVGGLAIGLVLAAQLSRRYFSHWLRPQTIRRIR
jgi:sigma-E factor negative regulatory protein RseC